MGWVYCNDACVRSMPSRAVESQHAYILIYERPVWQDSNIRRYDNRYNPDGRLTSASTSADSRGSAGIGASDELTQLPWSWRSWPHTRLAETCMRTETLAGEDGDMRQ